MKQDAQEELRQRVGRRIREIRISRALTQEELAARAGVKPETISRVERATVWPDLRTLARIAKILAVRLGDLLDPPSSVADELGPEERDVVAAWRDLSGERRTLGLNVLRAMREGKVGD